MGSCIHMLSHALRIEVGDLKHDIKGRGDHMQLTGKYILLIKITTYKTVLYLHI